MRCSCGMGVSGTLPYAYVRVRTSSTSSPTSNPLYQTIAFEPLRSGTDGLDTTERSMPPCCVKRSNLTSSLLWTASRLLIRMPRALKKN
jgi:hypothetical protein